MDKPHRFNLRAYLLLMDDAHEQLLVSDEWISGKAYTKFPGGGVEFGEGIAETIMREAREELGQEVRIQKHFYTTDFFIASAFRPQDQVVSIYYLTRLVTEQSFRTSEKRFDFRQHEHDEESFRWVKKEDLIKEVFAFPADRKVQELLLDGWPQASDSMA
jgi:ADP-ribose pyrophosphatase YjhB (NUDIX family)